jgi:hypothetical protein
MALQATLDTLWVPAGILPARFKIEAVEERYGETKKGKYQFFALTLSSKGQFYIYEAKFGDKNFLINTAGKDASSWVGIEIGLEIGADGYKTIVR